MRLLGAVVVMHNGHKVAVCSVMFQSSVWLIEEEDKCDCVDVWFDNKRLPLENPGHILQHKHDMAAEVDWAEQ